MPKRKPKRKPKLPPLKHGDKLYNHFIELETAFFVREQIAPGATKPTYIIRKSDGSRAQVNPDMYVRTEKQANQRWLKSARAAIPGIIKQRKELAGWLKSARAAIPGIIKQRKELADSLKELRVKMKTVRARNKAL